MARLRAPHLPPGAPTNIKGALVFRKTANGIVIAAWPKKRGRATQGSQLYRQLEFGKAAYMAAHPAPIDLLTAYEQVKGTTMVPRDTLQQAAMGVAYDVDDIDGNEWRGWRMVQANAQFMLDQVTSEEGAMLWRAPVGWVEVPPGEVGQVLALNDDNEPEWADLAAGALAGWELLQYWDQATDGNATQVVTPVIGAIREALVIALGVTRNAAGNTWVQLSANGGSSYFSGSDTYKIDSQASITSPFGARLHNDNTAAARWSIAHLSGLDLANAPRIIEVTSTGEHFMQGLTAGAVDRIRVIPVFTSTLTGGKIYILGRR